MRALQNSVDVEVAVSDRSMDIGVFSTSASYSESQVTELVQHIVDALDEAE